MSFCLAPLYAELDHIFYEPDQNIVIATKQFQFEHFPDAFNPSLIRFNDQFLLTFRYCPDRANQNWLSYIGVAILDESLNLVTEPELLKTRQRRSKTPSQTEDARLFSYKNKIFLIYNDNIDEIFFDQGKRRDMFIAELVYADGQFTVSLPLKLNYELKTYTQWQQKNWVPFEWNNNLFFSYRLNPHEVISSSLKNGTCYFSHETNPILNWEYGTLRPSSPPLLVDGEYLAFFHSGIRMRSPASPGWKAWHYFTGAYTFSAEPPFEITQISPTPILGEGFYALSSHEKRVIFPGGFVVDGPYIHLAYGKDDCEIWIATLDKAALQKSLIPVEMAP